MVRHRVEEKNHKHGDCQSEGIWAINVVLEAVLEGLPWWLRG